MKVSACRVAPIFFLLSSYFHVGAVPPGRDFYEIRVYQLSGKEQQGRMESYLKAAFVPALHRAGISRVGVFTPVESDTANFGKRIFVLIPYTSLDQYAGLGDKLDHDPLFQTAGADYQAAPYDAPPYLRMESIVLRAFIDHPNVAKPSLEGDRKDNIYELRSYEGPTEKKYWNKVRMFNEGDEIGLFKRLGFNAVFYAEVLSGSRMPNLMYMTSFSSMTSRDEHWKKFVDDPQWKKLTAMPEYQHNVSKITITLLHPADFSDF
jgi:hypothetical protein